MQILAKLNYLRIAPRKVRLVADLIRGKSVEEAKTILNFTIKKSTKDLSKLLKSAIANAKNNFQLEEKNLYISKILVNEGPKYKRWRARARGQAAEIQKKTSHITLILDEIIKKPPKKVKKIKKVEVVEKKEKSKEITETEKSVKEIKLPAEKAKFRPEIEKSRPKTEKDIKRIFRRKSF
jgi:large subunit ribosomal protein L22